MGDGLFTFRRLSEEFGNVDKIGVKNRAKTGERERERV